MHDDDGNIEFYTIASQKTPFVGTLTHALPPLPWRKEKVSE
jgi:hypothetical protein